MNKTYAIALHGGAGTIDAALMTAEVEKKYRDALMNCVTTGELVLKNGGSAIDAVTVTVQALEDCPLFNAGCGAVFTHEKTNELDASIMNGATGEAGAVAGVKNIKNPIVLAKKVMEASEHVLLAGTGAMDFAKLHNIATAPDSYFFTDHRWKQLLEIIDSSATALDHSVHLNNPKPMGTVGAVALDQNGHLAAATSTGGMTNKRFGRLGDSPIIGAGNWADKQVAISCTGHGEFFIKHVVAYNVAARIKLAGEDIFTATQKVVMEELLQAGGEGGLIAIDKHGNIALPFNSAGMYRAWASNKLNPTTAIYAI